MTSPAKHPATTIPAETVAEIAYRVYLARLEPPLTPEESVRTWYLTKNPVTNREVMNDDASRRRSSGAYLPLTRAFLRVLVDMEMVKI